MVTALCNHKTSAPIGKVNFPPFQETTAQPTTPPLLNSRFLLHTPRPHNDLKMLMVKKNSEEIIKTNSKNSREFIFLISFSKIFYHTSIFVSCHHKSSKQKGESKTRARSDFFYLRFFFLNVSSQNSLAIKIMHAAFCVF